MNNTFGLNIIPEKDLQRIQSLEKYKILDSDSEAVFDQVVKIATQVFNVPISLISFVAEEDVFFKANVGLQQYKSLPRSICPCSESILSREVTILSNCQMGSTPVDFYAAAPLICPNGALIGTLCIMDHKPVNFSLKDQHALQELAKLVMEHLEVRLAAIQSAVGSSEKKQRILNEQRWKTMVMSSPMGMAVLQGRQLVIEIVNQPMLTFWQVIFEDVIEQPFANVLPESISKDLPSLLEEIFETALPLAISETCLERHTDEGIKKIYADVTYDPLFDLDGNVDAIMVTVINITEVVEARKLLTAVNEEIEAKNKLFVKANNELADTQDTLKMIIGELANSEARFRGVFERAPLGMALLSGPSKVVEFANENMLKFWGKDQSILGLPHRLAVPELEGQNFEALIDKVYTSGIAFKGHEQKALTIQNGLVNKGYYNFVYEPIKDERGVTSILIIADDVTEEVRTRKQSNRTSQMLNMAVESAELGTWFYDIETNQFFPSTKLKSLFGYKADELLPYTTALEFITSEYREEVVGAITSALKNGESYDLEFPIKVGQSEAIRWIRATGNLNKPEADKPSYFSGIIMDVTARKLDDQRKNDFIAMVSHELKTPLTSLKAYVQILISKANKVQDDYAVAALNKAEQQINKMNTLIKSFLDVARLEAGKINLNIEPFDISELIQDVVTDASEIMGSHELIFNPCKEIHVNADKDKIAQVITNFLSNAVKYSAKGKNIFVSCQENNGRIQISVKDEGIGIKPQDIDKLFNRFYRIENTDTQTISGFGIGLYLCAEIIKRHNGHIWVDSEPGSGSTFHFSIQQAYSA
jgi:two-component system sensor histidine kinase VicK